MKDFFCPNCGTKLKAGTKFCPNCGTNVANLNGTSSGNDVAKGASVPENHQRQTPDLNDLKRETGTAAKSFVEKWNQNKKRNNYILAGVVVLVIFLLWGHSYYSVDNQMARATTAIGDPSKNAGKYVTSTSSEVKINNQTVKPIQKYFQKYPGDLSTMKKKFQDGSKWTDYQFVQKGRAWLIWPRYKIQAAPTYMTINTDQKGMDVKMDGQELGKVTSNSVTSDSNTNASQSGSQDAAYSRSFGPYLPGLHTFVGTKSVGGHDIKTTLTSSDDSITINNGISNDAAQSLLSNVFQSHVEDNDELFMDGQNNEGYKQLVTMFDGYNHNDDVSSPDVKVNVNNVEPESNTKYKVNYQVRYTFMIKNDDNDYTKKIQVFKYTGVLVKTNDQNDSNNNGLKIQSLGHAKKVSESKTDAD